MHQFEQFEKQHCQIHNKIKHITIPTQRTTNPAPTDRQSQQGKPPPTRQNK